MKSIKRMNYPCVAGCAVRTRAGPGPRRPGRIGQIDALISVGTLEARHPMGTSTP